MLPIFNFAFTLSLKLVFSLSPLFAGLDVLAAGGGGAAPVFCAVLSCVVSSVKLVVLSNVFRHGDRITYCLAGLLH